MLHLDIASNEMLYEFVKNETEPIDVIQYDRDVNRQLSKLYEIAQRITNI